MRNLIRFISRQHFVLLFILLEFFSIVIIVNNNYFQRAKFFNLARSVSGNFYENVTGLKEYLYLKKINEELMLENVMLKNKLETLHSFNLFIKEDPEDTLSQLSYIPAKVINNSVNKQYNYLTLNKGKKHGLEQDMAVISFGGLVGRIEAVSDNYAVVISLLNRDSKVSGKIKKNQYYGSLQWHGRGYQTAYFYEIPQHVKINKGDTIVTSGFSDYFPEGIMIGTIKSFKKDGNFYNIKVNLSTDFKNLYYVNVVYSPGKKEQIELENMIIQ